MNDIRLIETGNGGDIAIRNGDIDLDAGIFNNIYLAWFGGNVGASTEDVGVDDIERFDWWGNVLLFPGDSEKQFNSRLEHLLNTRQLNSAGVAVIETIARADLDFMAEIADISVDASIVGVDRLRLGVLAIEKITGIRTEFTVIWQDQRIMVLDENQEPIIFTDENPAEFFIAQNDIVDGGQTIMQGEGVVRELSDDVFSVNDRGELIVDGPNENRFFLDANGNVIFN